MLVLLVQFNNLTVTYAHIFAILSSSFDFLPQIGIIDPLEFCQVRVNVYTLKI